MSDCISSIQSPAVVLRQLKRGPRNIICDDEESVLDSPNPERIKKQKPLDVTYPLGLHSSQAVSDINRILYSRLDRSLHGSDSVGLFPGTIRSLHELRQPPAKYYHSLDSSALRAWLNRKGYLQLSQPLFRPTVSLYETGDERWFYLSFEATKTTALNKLFMKVEVGCSMLYGRLLLWAFDRHEPEYRQVRLTFDADYLQLLRLQQLLNMMIFFMSYKSVTTDTTGTMQRLLYIDINPFNEREVKLFLNHVVNANKPRNDPDLVVVNVGGEPRLYLDDKVYKNLLQRYITLYANFHRTGLLPSATM